MSRRRQRLTKRERASRILNRINKAGDKGISARQIARAERISPGRIYYYLRELRPDRTRDRRIDRLGKRYYPVRPLKVLARTKSPPTEIRRADRMGRQPHVRPLKLPADPHTNV